METIFNEIAREIKSSTNRAVNEAISYIGLDLGSVTSTGLKLDNFKYEIQDYMMLDYLKIKNEYNTETAGEHLHSHNLKIPKELKTLATGERVLVALLGNEFVVVGRVVNA
ncbi:hypothetical protein [Clostridium botulinum]|uniref:hypothetical protein n=1 Tax=Clostridium botulinum TaxID=1491 RepID=UPI00094734B1|nr:hypothetical protein [Clostridium botulinum]APQ78273.1 hypothetical protein RSJ10_2389 [Clostridium botulinum]MBN3353999.1 hypothetical protein [Clostridium botulinum]QDY29399.1 hypothetical protein CGQ41_11555 [Clostridium botulinum]